MVFDGSLDFPRDLRLFDDDGTQWPWYLHHPKPSSRFQKLKVETLNRLMMETPSPHLQLELEIAAAKRPRHNQIRIETAGSDFIRKVEIFGL